MFCQGLSTASFCGVKGRLETKVVCRRRAAERDRATCAVCTRPLPEVAEDFAEAVSSALAASSIHVRLRELELMAAEPKGRLAATGTAPPAKPTVSATPDVLSALHLSDLWVAPPAASSPVPTSLRCAVSADPCPFSFGLVTSPNQAAAGQLRHW
ncbi:hypothetical protein GCM10010273_55800 [Streptomyces lavendulocolor]